MMTDVMEKYGNLWLPCRRFAVGKSVWDPGSSGGYDAAPSVEEEIVSSLAMEYLHTAPRAGPVGRDASAGG